MEICSKFLSKEVAEVVIPGHLISGYDNCPGFYGHGKKAILSTIIKDAEARELLSKIGRSISLTEDVISDMRKFVLSKIYGEDFPTCAEARASKWNKLKKKKTSRLPPDEDTLVQHFKKVNYLAYCQIHFSMKQHPSPIGNGWEVINGKCRPVRYMKGPLPDGFEPVHVNENNNNSDSDESEYRDSTDEEDN